jgi:hypothetical protein
LLFQIKKEPPNEAQNNPVTFPFQSIYFDEGFHQYTGGKSSGLGQELMGGTSPIPGMVAGM